MNFVENLALDIPVVQSFAEQKIGNALETTPQFLELQQLVGLIRADQPHEFLDPIVRAQKYPNLRPTALTKALQKYLVVLPCDCIIHSFILVGSKSL